MWYLNDFAKPDVNYPEYCSNPSGVYLLSRATVYNTYGMSNHKQSKTNYLF